MPTPIDWRQLCAVARELLKADPTIDNFEWSERIKDRILKIGKTYPARPDAIHAAMRAVERVHHRPAPTLPTPPPPDLSRHGVGVLIGDVDRMKPDRRVQGW